MELSSSVLIIIGVIFVTVNLDLVKSSSSSYSSPHSIKKRGVPIGQIPHGTEEAANSALDEINSNERLAQWSASSAVGQSVGRDYNNRVATTGQYVAQFTVPVGKEGAQELFDTISNHQKASDISAVLASNSRSINRAASNAASSNYDQAYQAEQLGYNRPGGSGGGGGYGGGSSNVYY